MLVNKMHVLCKKIGLSLLHYLKTYIFCPFSSYNPKMFSHKVRLMNAHMKVMQVFLTTNNKENGLATVFALVRKAKG